MTDRFPYEENAWSSSLEQKKFWFEQLERTGLAAVKLRLAQHAGGSAGSIAVGTEISMTKGFAEEWLAWHEAKAAQEEAAFRATQARWVKIAGWAAVIAAIAGVLGLVLQVVLQK